MADEKKALPRLKITPMSEEEESEWRARNFPMVKCGTRFKPSDRFSTGERQERDDG